LAGVCVQEHSLALIYLHYSNWRLGQGQDPRCGTVDRCQGEGISALTDLLSKHGVGGKQPPKDYHLSGVIGNISHQESAQLLQVPTTVLASYIQGKDAAS